MTVTKFSDYLDLKHYKKAKKQTKHLALTNRPQSFSAYHTYYITFSEFRPLTEKYVPVSN